MTGGMIYAPLCNAPLNSAPPHPATQRNAPTFPPHLRRDGRKTIHAAALYPAPLRSSPLRVTSQRRAPHRKP